MYFPHGIFKEGLFEHNIYKGDIPNDYKIPKELSNPKFDIIEYVTKSLKFSEDMMMNLVKKKDIMQDNSSRKVR